ncbi:latexin-like [Dendrobates tinctorius]|uniref:latexin-like n=1 Tax=Dendrobates tinctorius TaxID=92724 RepID=UPI003CC97FCD
MAARLDFCNLLSYMIQSSKGRRNMEKLNPTHYPASRATVVVMNHINYKLGGPNRLYDRLDVTTANKEVIPGLGNKYYLKFSIEDALNKKEAIKCTAEVLYYTNKQIAPNVTYSLQPEPQNYTAAKDNEFYSRIRGRSEPLIAEDIPDSFGNIAPDMEPIWHLALASCAFVKLQNATEETLYSAVVIKKVTEVKRDDAALEFHYDVLIHQMVTQEMEPWSIESVWDPIEGLRIKKSTPHDKD